MAIRPISSVSFNNYVTFGAKKKQSHPEARHNSTIPIKAIPIAALLAMSPMVEITEGRAQNLQKINSIEIVEAAKQKVVATAVYTNASIDGTDANMEFISTDDNDEDFELVSIKFRKNKIYRSDTGEANRVESRGLKLKGLKIQNVTETYDNNPPEKFKRYYITGDGSYYLSRAIAKDGRILDKDVVYSINSIEVNKNFYEYLKNLLEDDITYEVEDVVEDGYYNHIDELEVF